jgi:hypothetical protein
MSTIRNGVLACCVGLAACGGGGGGGSSSDGSAAGAASGAGSATPGGPNLTIAAEKGDPLQYFPFRTGNRWAFRRESKAVGSTPSIDVTEVRSTQVSGDALAVVLRNDDPADDPVRVDSNYVKSATGLSFTGDDSGDVLLGTLVPYAVARLPLQVGDTFTQVDKPEVDYAFDIDGDRLRDKLSLQSTVRVAGFETVATELGTFENVARIETTYRQSIVRSSDGARRDSSAVTTEWYAPGLGPVKRQVDYVRPDGNDTVRYALIAYAVDGRRSDWVAPRVVSALPAAGGNVAPVSEIRVTVDEDLDPGSVDAAAIGVADQTGQAVPGRVFYADRTIAFQPLNRLSAGTYTVALSSRATDLAGNPLAETPAWSFSIDRTGPAFVDVWPREGTTGVPLTASVTIDFDDDLDPSTLSSNGTVFFNKGNVPVRAYLTYANRRVTLTPDAPLEPMVTYTIVVSTLVKDKAGNPLRAGVSWTFTTEGGPFPAVNLIDSGTGSAGAVGDLDGDGRRDIVVATYTPAAPVLRVFGQDAAHRFALRGEYPGTVPLNCAPSALTIADVTSDGRADVILNTDICGLQVFAQDGNGAFVPGAYLPANGGGKAVAADVNRDGRADLIVLGATPGTVEVSLQLAGGGFAPAQSIATAITLYPGTVLVSEDFNGDGLTDVALVGNVFEPSVGRQIAIAVLLQQGAGGFGAPAYVTFPEGDTDDMTVVARDLDGDGRGDLLVSLRRNGGGLRVVTLRASPLGMLGSARSFDMYGPTLAYLIHVGDLDGDRRADLMWFRNRGLEQLYQQADGTFAATPLLLSASSAEDWASWDIWREFTDLDGDGRPDLVGLHPFQGLWLAYRSVPATNIAAKRATVGARPPGIMATPAR